MTFQTTYGIYLNHIFQEDRAAGEELHSIIAYLSMLLRTGAPWRDLPPDYGDWKNTHRRFCRWRDKGIWEELLEILIDDPDFEWLMIDATHVKVHQHAASARGGNQMMSCTKGG